MADIHPLIRVVTLLLFSAGVSLARPALIGAGFITLLAIYLYTGFPAMGRLLSMLSRLRWLMLAILLIYGWWTPGTALLAAYPTFSPTLEGLQLGLLRMAVLALIVAAVHILLQKTEREQLLAALMQLLSPVSTRAVRERIAVRIFLTMKAVGQIQPLMQATLSRLSRNKRKIAGLGSAAAEAYAAVIDAADEMGSEVIELPDRVRPAAIQWLIPLLLLVGIALLV